MQVKLRDHFVHVRVKNPEIVQDIVENLGLDGRTKVVVATIEVGIVPSNTSLPILPLNRNEGTKDLSAPKFVLDCLEVRLFLESLAVVEEEDDAVVGT